MPQANQSFAASELFTYSRLTPTPVVDVAYRLASGDLPATAAARTRWARARLQAKDAMRGFADLAFPYAALLKEGFDPASAPLPGRADLREADGFDPAAIEEDPAWQADLRRVREHFMATMLAGDDAAMAAQRKLAARLVQFVEGFPDTAARVAGTPYAPVLAQRSGGPVAKASARPAQAPQPSASESLGAELVTLAGDLRQLWAARDARLAALDDEYRALRTRRADMATAMLSPAAAKATAPKAKAKAKPAKGAKTTKPAKVARASGPSPALAARRSAMQAAEKVRRARDDAAAKGDLGQVLAAPAGLFGGRTSAALDALIDRIGGLIDKHDLPRAGFCQVYARLLEKLDQVDGAPVGTMLPASGADEQFDAPAVLFTDSVQMLGKAELVRVEEEFVSYSAAEISYVQTVLPGERRIRKTRSANVQESLLEQVADETVERVDESTASTKSELKSEIETELRSRFDSNVSASGSGSGGGSLALVNFSGSGSISAGLGLGLDTGARTRNESQFSQEIVRKAVERTNRRTLERRVTRTTQSYSASDFHEISNSDTQVMNGTYVFLNKQVAVTETVYGVRAFMEAKLLLPGRSLVAARRSMQRIAEEKIGERPRFAITPADITPANYLRLAGLYRASNVEPPPAPVTTLTRVYKTDTAAATSAPETFNGRKLAEVLVPFYGRYQRFAITDNIELPEGYEVLDVDIAVSHGANGVSLPAHLPLTLPGTAFYAGVSFMPFVMGLLGIAFLPAWIWSVAFMGSPLLHYNTDSSSVTVTVGTQARDSAYYFFEPDELLDMIMELLGAISAASPRFIERLSELALERLQEMQTAAAALPAEMATKIKDSIEGAVGKVRVVLDKLTASPPDLTGAAGEVFNVGSASLSLDMPAGIDAIFAPLRGFIGDLAGLLENEVGDAISAALSGILSRMENNQRLHFTHSAGLRGKLPVAVNALALNPGVTINLNACLKRSPEALARWQLRTFESFYQAHLQQVAAYENAYYSGVPQPAPRSPGLMRRDERIALKERVIAALHARHPTPDGVIPIERLELFEHAIDWDNMTYRLFDYGPSARQVDFDSAALLAGADEERRRFLLASWAQTMIPLSDDEGLVGQFLDYLAGGGGRVADAVGSVAAEVPELDELTALYRDLVLSRAQLDRQPASGEPRFVTLPTDLVALFHANLASALPRNPAYPAS